MKMGKVSYHYSDGIELKLFLDSKVELYHRPEFIETDPIQIPHLFRKREDIEIAGFLAATKGRPSSGNRKNCSD